MTVQLSREDIRELRSDLSSWQEDYSPTLDAEQYQLFDRAMAAMDMLLGGLDSKPVAHISKADLDAGYPHILARRDFNKACPMAVYAAPPAPVMPDHMTLIEKGRLMMLERSRQTLLDYRADSVWYWQGDEDDQPESLSCPVIMSAETLRELLAKSAPPAPMAVPDEQHSERFEWSYEDWANHLGGRHQNNDPACYYEFGSFMAVAEMLRQFGNVQRKIGWNSCRVAMLKAGPVTVWIKCSERMPEEGGRYWCYVEEQNSLGKSHYQWNCSWNGDEWSDKALTGRVTHWMPLPAVPEQGV